MGSSSFATRSAFKAQDQGSEGSFCHGTAGQRLSREERFFPRTPGTL